MGERGEPVLVAPRREDGHAVGPQRAGDRTAHETRGTEHDDAPTVGGTGSRCTGSRCTGVRSVGLGGIGVGRCGGAGRDRARGWWLAGHGTGRRGGHATSLGVAV
ncbi:hypothetical protein Slu03_03500 [Sediminihabitans luteus]|nr:hypothetical protein Slu03_03500 [Sediminihabitans luteus]